MEKIKKATEEKVQEEKLIIKNSEEKLIHDMVTVEKKNSSMGLFLGAVVIIFLGGLTGYLLVPKANGGSNGNLNISTSEGKKSIGSNDTKTFRDSAEGVLQTGGVDGEGTHKLVRPGGDSQTVYLTSTIMDLNEFVGKKVKVWGETFAGQKAGWLMDVGRVEILK
ncbi:MAG: hypothetical protein UU37_C0001G0020 [Candidatus Gottesmanbacteria bacterium GW2011_GWA2_41_12]|uniref:Uncharacterized protein n=2 Tax=Candidatus Gottesmaniibacteriota TaxID=1752720 RepID=A0A0G0UM59_9BACT|nr:MAG: hypothetical protein UT63_C0005G0022 [Candidatus Gottesmanbacteria bacterium GW2011_GWC2_39_8]KKR88601.1 MAG: hypothetical protein UU37_C0001G0020 [Candidatus Gottesmanbacteria bacterium GW2011_GWA2_41_12]